MQNLINATKPWYQLGKENLVLLFFIVLKLLICALPFEYGYFRDELYTVAHSHHLAFGYVALPPLLPLCLAAVRFFMGSSLFALHLFSGLTGVVVLIVTRMMVQKMGGGFLALFLALACVTLAPCYLSVESMVIYDCLGKMFWALALYYLVALVATEDKKYCLYFGVAVGLGLMSKLDMFFLGGGILCALLLTKQRKYFASWQLWFGALLAILIFSPYIIWNIQHNFITLEFMQQYATGVYHISIWEYLKNQIEPLNFLTLPVWILGLYYFLFDKIGKKFRLLGMTYIITFVIIIVMHTKFYVMLPFYVVLFAGGAVIIERLTKKFKLLWLWIVYLVLITAMSIWYIPLVRPVIPITMISKYVDITENMVGWIHNQTPTETGVALVDNISQSFHDRFGWEEMAAKVATIYNALPDEKKKNTFILAGNYGEAGAMDLYRDKYGLPPVICGHQQYFLWIPQNIAADSTFIVVKGSRPGVKSKLDMLFKQVKQVATLYTPYAIYYENNAPIYLCEGLKIPVKDFVQNLKDMHM